MFVSHPSSISRKFIVKGSVNDVHVDSILRDTGCTSIIGSSKLFPNLNTNNCTVTLLDYLGRSDKFPVINCKIKCPFYDCNYEAIVAPLKHCDVLIGNVENVIEPKFNSEHFERVSAVTTRSKIKKLTHPLNIPVIEPLNIDPVLFKELQSSCQTLATLRDKGINQECVTLRNGTSFKFLIDNNLLYRECLNSPNPNNIGKRTLVVPFECRNKVLTVAHENIFAGHFSHRKTEAKVREHFFWPNMGSDIRSFCRSCDKCQRYSSKGRVKNAPLVKVPIITEPFYRVNIDLVGPLIPSEEGHRYILTLVDVATGFPEAVPLKEIDSTTIAEALLGIFARVGIPRELLSDRGSQFTSQLLGDVHNLLGIKPLFTTPYHPMGSGKVERLHSVLKSCLKKLSADYPKPWHKYLIPTLFALREIPSDRTGFSAFELVYGRQVRGPLCVLRDLWEDCSLGPEERSSYQYVIELRDKLDSCAKIAAKNVEVSVGKYKSYFDLKSQDRKFNVGDEVLLLLPDSRNKLLMAWMGPFKVLEKRNRVNYLIDQNGTQKLYHVNILKRYFRRPDTVNLCLANSYEYNETPPNYNLLAVCQNCIVEQPRFSENETPDSLDCSGLEFLDSSKGESVTIGTQLTGSQKDQVHELLSQYTDVLSEVPGCTNTVIHDIELLTDNPVRSRVYPVPLHLRPHFEKEVENLLDLGIIRPSKSPYCSPCVMALKSDGSYRLTVDFRDLNSITKFNAEPPCFIDEELFRFNGARFISELDICKAYHQIMLKEEIRHLTAFPTHLGLMEYVRMPFGLVCAVATYISLMRIVLKDLPGVIFYFDNIWVCSNNWPDHINDLKAVLERLRLHGLTARPSKCSFGVNEISYLGFKIKNQCLSIPSEKVSAISRMSPPNSKKALRSLLGLLSYYRKFIPNFANLTSVLTDMVKKGISEPLVWSDIAVRNFEQIKTLLTGEPILRLPDISKTFVLRTDASSTSVGAVLLQYHDSLAHPVAYASRKLVDRETRYSTIERECLAIIYAVSRFYYYLLGQEFILEVDHKPLVYLSNLKNSNSRLMRWALSLQPFKFRIVYIPGPDNLGADLLSRTI